MAKDSKGHGSEGRGRTEKTVSMIPGRQSEYPAHAQGVASTPHTSYLGRMTAADMTDMMTKYPLVPPSSAPHGALPDSRLSSRKPVRTMPGL